MSSSAPNLDNTTSPKNVVETFTYIESDLKTEDDGSVVEMEMTRILEKYDDGTSKMKTEIKKYRVRKEPNRFVDQSGKPVNYLNPSLTPENSNARKTENTTDPDFIQGCLIAHNKLRARHGAPPLVLDPELGKIAQAWANVLAVRGKVQHQSIGFGENVYWNASLPIASRPPEAWYSEINMYDWSNIGGQSGTGHFTQVIWKKTVRVGIALAKDEKDNGFYVVANYYPPGNVVGRYLENIEPYVLVKSISEEENPLEESVENNKPQDEIQYHGSEMSFGSSEMGYQDSKESLDTSEPGFLDKPEIHTRNSNADLAEIDNLNEGLRISSDAKLTTSADVVLPEEDDDVLSAMDLVTPTASIGLFYADQHVTLHQDGTFTQSFLAVAPNPTPSSDSEQLLPASNLRESKEPTGLDQQSYPHTSPDLNFGQQTSSYALPQDLSACCLVPSIAFPNMLANVITQESDTSTYSDQSVHQNANQNEDTPKESPAMGVMEKEVEEVGNHVKKSGATKQQKGKVANKKKNHEHSTVHS